MAAAAGFVEILGKLEMRSVRDCLYRYRDEENKVKFAMCGLEENGSYDPDIMLQREGARRRRKKWAEAEIEARAKRQKQEAGRAAWNAWVAAAQKKSDERGRWMENWGCEDKPRYNKDQLKEVEDIIDGMLNGTIQGADVERTRLRLEDLAKVPCPK